MREAAASPERDFRQYMDVVRAAASERINSGRLPEQRRYISLSAIYADRAVIELDGKHFQYPYSFTVVSNTEQLVLGAPVQVVEQYVPVVAAAAPAQPAAAQAATAVREALADGGASFREAADGSIEVTLIKAGLGLAAENPYLFRDRLCLGPTSGGRLRSAFFPAHSTGNARASINSCQRTCKSIPKRAARHCHIPRAGLPQSPLTRQYE